MKIFSKTIATSLLMASLTSIAAPTVMASGIVEPLATEEVVELNENSPLRLWYDEEAPYGQENTSFGDGGTPKDLNDGWERWSLPLGNGYFGANVFGRTDIERIQLTEKTLCNDYGSSAYNPGGLNNFSETYLDFGHDFSSVSDYSRYLDLKTAISGVSYTYEGVTYEREYFTSYEDYCMVIKLTASEDGKLDFTLRPTIPYLQDFAYDNNDTSRDKLTAVTKHGKVTSSVSGDTAVINMSGHMGQFGVDFEAQYRVFTDGNVNAGTWTHTYNTNVIAGISDEFNSGVRDEENQTLTVTNGTLEISGASEAYIVVCLGTNYDQSKGEGNSAIYTSVYDSTKLSVAGVDAKAYNDARMTSVLNNSFANSTNITEGYEKLRSRHVADYSELFGKVNFTLDYDSEDLNRTTDELLTRYQNDTGDGHYLEMLYYQYGRYLLIASSRSTTLPANLQGTWNRYNYAPWGSGYWHNINEQMNYWHAFSTGLTDCFGGYVNFIDAYIAQARKNAKTELSRAPFNYTGSDTGFTIGIGITPYKVGSSASCGELGFTTQMFWEYYMYTQDETILKDIVYPILYEAAQFITKTVAYNESEDAYLSIYSYSPEQFNNSTGWYYTEGTPYAQSFAYLNNAHLLSAAEILGIDIASDTLLSEVQRQVDKYDAILVGYSGQIKEFREEEYYGDIGEYTHRHISHLVGLYPGEMINSNTPAWLDAAIVTLTERGDKATGWGVAHRLNLWSHTKLGDRTYLLLEQLLKSNTATNLWDLHHPFQVDGNFGATAGITEMLMQSHEGYIDPLAAIPASWSDGSFSGLVARGNFTVDASWSGGNLTSLSVTSGSGKDAKIHIQNVKSAKITDSKGESVSATYNGNDFVSFATTAGETYTITSIPSKVTVAPAQNLAVTQSSKNSFTLTWDPSGDAVSYNVYKAVEDDSDYTLIGNTTSLSYVYGISSEEEGARMTYNVRAVNSAGIESVSELEYVTPDKVEISETQAVVLADGRLQVAVGSFYTVKTYSLYEYDSSSSTWVKKLTSDYPVLIYDAYSSANRYGVSVSSDFLESEITEITEIGEIGADGGLVEDTEYNIFTGVTASDVVLSGIGFYPAYPVINVFDGNTGTRFAPVDKKSTPFTIEVTLSSVYNIKTVRVYDFKNSGETGTRSDNTKIEVYADGVWTALYSGVSLDRVSGKTYCEFDLGFAKAEKIRFTFENTQAASSPSLWEITATGAKLSYADRSELLEAVKNASAIDISKYDATTQTRISNEISKSVGYLGSMSVAQDAIDAQTEALRNVISDLPEGEDLDLNVTETVYDGSTALPWYGGLPTEGGLYGKADSDLAYLLNEARSFSFNVMRDTSYYAKDYTLEFSLALAKNASLRISTKTIATYTNGVLGADGWNGGPQINFDGNSIFVSNGHVTAVDGVPTGSNSNTLCDMETGKWYKIAIVIPITEGKLTDTIDVCVNGTKYTISINAPFYGLSYPQFEKMNQSTDAVYIDNLCQRFGSDAIYYTERDALNNLVSSDSSLAEISKAGVINTKKILTVAELKALVGNDIRVFTDSSCSITLDDVEYVLNGMTVVAFANNGRSYERTYNYYSVTAPAIVSNKTVFNADDGEYPFNETAFATTVDGVFGNSTDVFYASTAGKSSYTRYGYYGPKDGNDWTVEFDVLVPDNDSCIKFYHKIENSAWGFSMFMGRYNNSNVFQINKATAVSGGNSSISGEFATLAPCEAGKWYKIAIVFPGDTSVTSNVVYVYINGVRYTVNLNYSYRTVSVTAFQLETGSAYLDNLVLRDETIITYAPADDLPTPATSNDSNIVLSAGNACIAENKTVADIKSALGANAVIRSLSILGDSDVVADGDIVVIPPTTSNAYTYLTVKFVAPKVTVFNGDNGVLPFNEAAFATAVSGAYGNPGISYMASTANKSTYLKYGYFAATAGNDWMVGFNVLSADSSSLIKFYTKNELGAFGFELYMGGGRIYATKSAAVSGPGSSINGANATLTTMEAGKWYNIVILFPGDSEVTGNTVYIYINGVKYTLTTTYTFKNITVTAFQTSTGTSYLDDIVITDSLICKYESAPYSPDSISVSEENRAETTGNTVTVYGSIIPYELKKLAGADIAVLNGATLLSNADNIPDGAKIVVRKDNGNGTYSYSYYNVSIKDALTRIAGASLNIGANLSVRYHVTLEAGESIENYSMRFTMNGKTVIVEDASLENGKYVFSVVGVSPQCMGDEIFAELLCGDEVVRTYDSYSVKAYVISALELYSDDENLKRLLSDILYYGAAAQRYVGYKLDSIVTDGVENILPESDLAPTESDSTKSLVTEDGADASKVSFSAVGVRFDYDNKIYVKVKTADASRVSITINGEALSLIRTSTDGVYIAYSEGIDATRFDESVEFKVSYDGSLVQTLTYTVNTYAYIKSADAEIGELAIALYRYGKSTEAYNA